MTHRGALFSAGGTSMTPSVHWFYCCQPLNCCHGRREDPEEMKRPRAKRSEPLEARPIELAPSDYQPSKVELTLKSVAFRVPATDRERTEQSAAYLRQ